MQPAIHFCSVCGAAVTQGIPPGDDKARHICPQCGTIHYQNPRMVVGTLPVWQGQVLLCRRAIEPRHGYWTLPAGFMENGESLEQAALRETSEEAGCQVELGPLLAVASIPFIHQVHFYYRATMCSPDLNIGAETLEAQLFSEADIPWEQLAFRSVTFALRQYFADLKAGVQQLHSTTLPPLLTPD